jgi:hypothetical protein
VDCGAGSESWRQETAPSGASQWTTDLVVAASTEPGWHGSCGVVLRAAGGAPATIATITVPVAVVIEPESGYSYDPDREAARGSGWVRVDERGFTGGGSVVALPPYDRPLPLTIPPLQAGAYWVDLGVYDYGTGQQNTVTVALNGVEQEVTWGGGTTAGVVHRVVAFADVPAGATLAITPTRRGQDDIAIDDVVVTSAPPPAGG